MTGVETGVASGVNSPYLFILLPPLEPSFSSSSWLSLWVDLLLCWLDLGVVAVVEIERGVDEIPAQVSNADIAMDRSSCFRLLASWYSWSSPPSLPPPLCENTWVLWLSKTETSDWANCFSCSCK
jgi:hypothetical protein